MLQQVLNNLQHDITLVQLYIKNNQDVGFSDMTRLLESLSIHLFKATHDLNLKNVNILQANFPAIDLVDDTKRTCIQVTTNADAKKVRHTLKVFSHNGLSKKYDHLIIFGFLSYSLKLKNLPTFCTVIGIRHLISSVIDKNDEYMAQDLVDALQQHRDFSRIHPYDDVNCLEIVLNCIDRNAIKHRMICEGSYDDMVRGMNEITELISKGTIDDFKDAQIRAFLSNVRDVIGKIIGIINECRVPGSGFVGIHYGKMLQIDKLKAQIINLSNNIAVTKGVNKRLYMI